MAKVPASGRVSYARMTLLAWPLMLLAGFGCRVLGERTGWPVGDLRVFIPSMIPGLVWFLALRWPLLQVPQADAQQPPRQPSPAVEQVTTDANAAGSTAAAGSSR